MNLTAESIALSLDKGRRIRADHYTACCPAHDDSSPSLSITQDGDRVLVHCFSGCTQDAVIDSLKARGLRYEREMGFNPYPPPRALPAIGRPDATHTEARAARTVSLATPAPDNHHYLARKRVQPHGIGVLGAGYKLLPTIVRGKGNVLVIPMQDIHGRVLSCQFIAEDGSKAYMAGPKRPGGFYFIEGNDRLWICEGFATGASLHEDTGDSVACAFDTGGLMPVTGALTALYPRRQIIVMADDDWHTDSNPGLKKAIAVAQAHGVKVVHPDFTGFSRGPKDTDFNDLVRLRHEL